MYNSQFTHPIMFIYVDGMEIPLRDAHNKRISICLGPTQLPTPSQASVSYADPPYLAI